MFDTTLEIRVCDATLSIKFRSLYMEIFQAWQHCINMIVTVERQDCEKLVVNNIIISLNYFNSR